MSRTNQKLTHEAYFCMFICMLISKTQIFQENRSVLMNFNSHGQVSLLPVISLRFLLKAWHRNHCDCVFHALLQALWQLYIALGLPCLEAPKAWLEAMFALGELHESPVLLLRASTTNLLLILISFHPEAARKNISLYSLCLSISTGFACLLALPTDWKFSNSARSDGELTPSLIHTLPHLIGAHLYTLVIQEQRLTNYLFLFLQHRKCYFIADQSQKPNRTNISGEELHHFSLRNVTQQSNNHGLP